MLKNTKEWQAVSVQRTIISIFVLGVFKFHINV